MKYLNPLTWSTLALQIVGGCLLAIVLFFYANYKLKNYYTQDMQKEEKAATIAADLKIANRNAENDKRTKEALNAKIKQLESNAASAKRADDSAVGLLDDLRSSGNRAKTELSSCIQYTDTVTGLFTSARDFAARVAKEANGHVTDKITCTAAWNN